RSPAPGSSTSPTAFTMGHVLASHHLPRPAAGWPLTRTLTGLAGPRGRWPKGSVGRVPANLAGFVSHELFGRSLSRSVHQRSKLGTMQATRERMEVTQVTPATTSFLFSLIEE